MKSIFRKKFLRNSKHVVDTLLTLQWVQEAIKGENKKYLEMNENEDTHTKIYGMQGMIAKVYRMSF